MALRFGYLPGEIREVASSDTGDSVRNLIRDIDYSAEEQPTWTLPLVSPKNASKSDI